MRIIGVVLNCPDWFNESARLMDVAFAEYEAITLLRAGDCLRTLPVEHADGAEVSALLAADLTCVAEKNALPSVELSLPDSVTAPVEVGQPLGEARLVWQGETLCAVPVIAGQDVPRDDFPARWERFWAMWPLLAP